MRCPDCNTFVRHELETEIISIEVDPTTGEITGEITLRLVCANCSTTLAETTASFYHDPLDIKDHASELEGLEDIWELTGNENVDPADTYEPPGKPLRAQKHLYYGEITATLNCTHCDSEWEVTFDTEKVAGSQFDPY